MKTPIPFQTSVLWKHGNVPGERRRNVQGVGEKKWVMFLKQNEIELVWHPACLRSTHNDPGLFFFLLVLIESNKLIGFSILFCPEKSLTFSAIKCNSLLCKDSYKGCTEPFFFCNKTILQETLWEAGRELFGLLLLLGSLTVINGYLLVNLTWVLKYSKACYLIAFREISFWWFWLEMRPIWPNIDISFLSLTWFTHQISDRFHLSRFMCSVSPHKDFTWAGRTGTLMAD